MRRFLIMLAVVSVGLCSLRAQVGTPSIDPRKGGIFDDGSPSGAMLTRAVRVNAVPVPWAEIGFSSQLFGSGTASFFKGSGGDGKTSPVSYNSDGSGTTLQITCPTQAAGSAGGVVIRTWFYGPLVGVRWVRNYSSTNNFSCFVDDVGYEIPQPLIYPDGSTTAAGVLDDWDHYFIIADALQDLPDGSPHLLELRFPQNYTGGSQQWQVSGLMLSPLGGYERLPRLQSYVDTAVLTTSFVSMMPNASAMRSITEVNYHNSSGASVLLTIQQNDQTICEKTLTATGTDGSTFSFTLPGNGLAVNRANTGAGSLTHKASAGSAIYALVIGSN